MLKVIPLPEKEKGDLFFKNWTQEESRADEATELLEEGQH